MAGALSVKSNWLLTGSGNGATACSGSGPGHCECAPQRAHAGGCARGVSSVLVPGAGEPNFDSLVANPYAGRKERREAEVANLLDKLQPDTIGLDPDVVGKVGVCCLFWVVCLWVGGAFFQGFFWPSPCPHLLNPPPTLPKKQPN